MTNDEWKAEAKRLWAEWQLEDIEDPPEDWPAAQWKRLKEHMESK